MPTNKKDPRRASGSRRNKLRKRVAAMGKPCHLCGRPIDYTLTTWVDPKDGRVKRHPMSFELDELVPVSLGGDPFDFDNVAPAHRICNQRRGNRPVTQGVREARGEKSRSQSYDAAPVETKPQVKAVSYKTSRDWLKL